MKSNSKNILIVALALGALVVVMVILITTLLAPVSMRNDQFVAHMRQGVVTEIDLNGDTVTYRIYGSDNRYRAVTFGRASVERLIDRYFHNIDEIEEFEGRTPPQTNLADRYGTSIWSFLPVIIMGLFVIFFFFMIFRNMGAADRKATSVGKSGVNAQSSLKTRFSDVAGAEEEKQELAEIVEFLKTPQKFHAAGAKIPRGVLLVGPPGTGKTLFAKAVSGEANVPFFSISGSDFVELYVGVGASRVRDLFDIAKRNKPCIVFIDEIDAVGRQRGAGMGGGHDEREQTLNQLLVQMDGFESNDEIIIMAATNRSDILDPALMRPGRFDRQIHVNPPDVRGREEIFKVHSRNKSIDPSVDFRALARITSGFTGADIANLLNEAAILAARDNRTIIKMADVFEGINKVTLGPQKKSRIITEYDKRITAYHEAGHAIVAFETPKSDPIHEVSIIPRGRAEGYVSFRPDNDDRHRSLGKLMDGLAVALGGRAAEEIVIKDICTGAVSDIKHATNIARHMVTEWGMSDLGPIYYGSDGEVFVGRGYGATTTHSEAMSAKIDAEVDKIITSAHKRAKEILSNHREKLDTMARILIECETIYIDEVAMIMEGKSCSEVLENIRAKYKTNVVSNNAANIGASNNSTIN
ncbi:MAG: ATP-dependent zinc metalloprotease FtsH [Firmicutes bacterium]|nr:ATP-dependent zinc metalloprotease FtsH [Bacillota bacterium]